LLGIDDAGKLGLTFLAIKTVAIESAAVDPGGGASTERKVRVAFRARDELSLSKRSWCFSPHELILSVQSALANSGF
jgi:hypothetical protein